MRIAEEHGFAIELGLARLLYGWSLTDAGEIEDGMAAMQRAWAELSTTNATVGAPAIISVLASGQANAGRIEDALSSLELALEFSKRQKNRSWDPALLCMKGELLARRDASGVEAESLFRAAIDLAHAQESRMFELRAATSLGRVLRGRGAASALVSPLYAAFTEGFDTRDLQEAKALLEPL
jgi:predicted ATPase